MKFTKLAATLLCTGVLFCGCVKDNDAVIKVNNRAITKAEFNNEYKSLKNFELKNAPKALQKETSSASYAIKKRVSVSMVARELMQEEFEKRNITASEEEINAQIDYVIKQLGSKEVLDNLMKENNITPEKFRNDMTEQVKIDKLINQLDKSKITDNDVKKFYNDNKAQFDLPQRVQVSHILFNTNENEVKKAIVEADKNAKLSQEEIEKQTKEEVAKQKALAEQVRQKALNNPNSFAQLAKEYSIDKATAVVGGDLGYIVKEQVVPEFGEVAFTQKVNTISPLTESRFGTHIILVKDKTKAGIQPLSEVKADIAKMLERQRKGEVLQKFIDGAKDKATIEYIDKTLEPSYLEENFQAAVAKQREAELKKIEKMLNPKDEKKQK